MNSETQKIQMVKSDREMAVTTISMIIYVGAMIYLMDPGTRTRVDSWIARTREQIDYNLSVWRSLLSIRSLPETEEQ